MSGSSRATPWIGYVPAWHELCAKCGGQAVGFRGGVPHCRAHRPNGIEEGDDATCEGCGESSATKYDDDGYRLCDECYAAAIEEESK